MTPIANPVAYTEGMRKSMIDKMFFMDKVDARVFIDYGCADGSLVKFLYQLFPEMQYGAYDIDPDMLKQVGYFAESLPDPSRIEVSQRIRDMQELSKRGKTCLILSSVIHEVYSYGSDSDIGRFWAVVTELDWDFIVIRDMATNQNTDRPASINSEWKVRQQSDPRRLAQFESRWGSISQQRNLMHYLLKYRYTENWNREVNENYLPLTREQLMEHMPMDRYDIIFHEHYVLPFLKRRVMTDFGVSLNDPTHIKLILEKR